jgi:hypothetical protein
MLGELLPISDDMIEHFKGDGDMTKVLDSDQTQALSDELISYHDSYGHLIELNGSVAYT